MESFEGNICCGCLSIGRKMSHVEDLPNKQYFLQIIREVNDVRPLYTILQLCWECKAHTSKFIEFKLNVQLSYQWLHEKYNSAYQKADEVKSKSRLKIKNIFNLSNLLLSTELDDQNKSFEVIKTEKSEPEIFNYDIKLEKSDDNTSQYSDGNTVQTDEDDDDKPLIQTQKRKVKFKKTSKRKNTTLTVSEFYKEVLLSKSEVNEERRQQSESDYYANAEYKCDRCILPFPNADDLQDHISVKHDLNSSSFKCNICKCSFASEVSFNYHANKHKKRFECVDCAERFRSKSSAAKHFASTHAVYQEGLDSQAELEIQSLLGGDACDDSQDERRVDAPPSSYPCAVCGKAFRWKTSLRKHAEKHRIESGLKRKPHCDTCRLYFTTTCNLQKHIKTSSKHQIQLKLRKLNGASTEQPPQNAANIEKLKSVVNASKSVFPCPHCDKKFQWKGNLLRHVQSHEARASGELVCTPCKRSFSSIATFQQHMKISKRHVSEAEFKYMCSDCGKRFANKTRLKDHVDWEHLKNYVHKCEICLKVFKSHTSLYLHKQVHDKHKAEYLCDHCGKGYPNRAKLRSHITAIHTSESPYRCVTCGARFSWHSCLSRHVRVIHKGKLTKEG